MTSIQSVKVSEQIHKTQAPCEPLGAMDCASLGVATLLNPLLDTYVTIPAQLLNLRKDHF